MKLNKPSCNICKALQKAIEAYIAKVDNDLENSMDDAGYVDSKDSVNAASDLEEEVTEILTEQTEELADVIEEAGTIPKAKKAVEEYFEDDVTGEILSATFRDYFSETILSLSDSYMKEVEGDMAVTQLRARTTAWVNQWSNDLANLMQLTSADKMKSLLQEALDSDKGAVVFARSLIDEGIRQEAYRARTVAVTEMLRAHSVAQQEAIMQSPATDRKKWRHSGAHKNEPRPNHVAMDGQIVPKAEPFVLTGRDGGTYYPMYPRDTELPPFESINCHCIHVPVTNDDVLGMSYEERKKMQEDFIAADDSEWKKEFGNQNMASSNDTKWPESGKKISKEELKDLKDFAKNHNVLISGFKDYDGDVSLIKECIEDVDLISKDFPKVKSTRKKVTLSPYDPLNSGIIANTENHIIYLNKAAFRDRDILEANYMEEVLNGNYVEGTNYRSIIKHEMGHVVSNIYGLDGGEIAMKITGKNMKETLEYLRKELSGYSAIVPTGDEIISEVFSDYYSNESPKKFSLKFMEECANIIAEKGGDLDVGSD